MFKACGAVDVVRANLDAVIYHGYVMAYEENPPVTRADAG